MNDKQSKQFHKDLEELSKKYPQCVVSAWMPVDYQSLCERKLTEGELNEIANKLRDSEDANVGISWSVIEDVISEVLKK